MSRRAKEAIKTALAMAVAYGIALWLDWDKPAWAATAIAAVSLSSIGQSLNKATMRIVGTLLAGVVALTIIGLFPQDRWLFALTIFTWVGFCTYMMTGPRNQYFWQVSGFVAAIVCVGSAGDLEGAFGVAVLRLQETGLGILVFSLISVFLWPVSSGAGFEAALKAFVANQRAFCAASFSPARGPQAQDAPPLDGASLVSQMAQQRPQVLQLFEAAATDSYAVEAERAQWARVVQAAASLADTLRRFQDVAADLGQLPDDGLEGLHELGTSLERRFAQIERLLAGDAEAFDRAPPPSLAERSADGLTHFQRAAVVVVRERCDEIDRAVDALLEALTALGDGDAPQTLSRRPRYSFIPDPDRLTAAFRAMLACWIVFFLWIYVEALPGGVTNVTFAAVFAMAAASMPQLPLVKILKPALMAVFLAALVTFFVMTQLEGYVALGLMIFAFSFFICYRYADPTQALGRLIGLAMFAVIANISNAQTYSFLAVANTALMFPIVLLAIALTAYVPLSQQPADVFVRLLRRFFRCAALLLEDRRTGRAGAGFLRRWQMQICRDQLARIPGKLTVWVGPSSAARGVDAAQLTALEGALQALADHVLDLAESSPLEPALAEACDQPIWQEVLMRSLATLRADPQGSALAGRRDQLAALVAELEARLEPVLGSEKTSASLDADIYRLLGAYRGVGRSLLAYAARAAQVDRAAWQRQAFP